MKTPPPDFVGREKELHTLTSWLEADSTSPIVVSGVGGVGKSSLAAKFAQEAKGKMPIEWVSVHGSPNTTADSFLEKLQDGSPSLVILDGLDEFPTQDASAIIRELSTGYSSKHVLLTSRSTPQQLRAKTIVLNGLSAKDAVALFSKSAGLIEDSHEASLLAAALGNLPLAIEIAAALAKKKSVGEVLAQLETKLYELENQRSEPPQQIIQTVEPTIISASDFLVESIRKSPTDVYNLPPRKFEELIATLLEDFGWDVHLTPATRDGGKDILAYLNTELGRILCLVEAKKYRADRPVGVDILRNLYGTLCDEKANSGLLVTTSYFSPDAKAFRGKHIYELNLKDYDGLMEWIAKYKNS